MGPGDKPRKERSSLSDPPYFSPHGDMQDWHRKIGRWVDVVKAAHDNGSDRHFQTIFKILGCTLYERGLPPDQQAMVDEAQAKRAINYLQVDDPVEAVRDIVKTIAVDPPIAMVARLINSFHKVTSCRRSRNEDLRVFVSRFRGLAATHLPHTNSSSSSQIREVLAVTLLNNANLDEGTLVNATSALITHADARAEKKEDDDTAQVSKKELDKLFHVVDKLSDLEKDRNVPRDTEERHKYMETFRSKCIDSIKQLILAAEGLKHPTSTGYQPTPVASTFISDQGLITLNLDNAVQVLRTLTQPANSNIGGKYSAREINDMVDCKVNPLLASYNLPGAKNQRDSAANSSQNLNKRHQSRTLGKRKYRNPRDQEAEKCFDCGSPGHLRGEDVCPKPSYLTTLRKKRRENDRAGGPSSKTNNPQGKFFRKCSGPGSGSQA